MFYFFLSEPATADMDTPFATFQNLLGLHIKLVIKDTGPLTEQHTPATTVFDVLMIVHPQVFLPKKK
jgi:hypothetical protein